VPFAHDGERVLERCVGPHGSEFSIVEAGPAQTRLVQLEPQRLHEVQVDAGIRTQANNIARIGWNLGLVQDQAEHIV
jgi:hypothetical protein